MSKLSGHYGLLVRLVICLAAAACALYFSLKLRSSVEKLESLQHMKQTLSTTLRDLENGMKDLDKVERLSATIHPKKFEMCTIERKSIITNITEYARDLGFLKFEITDVRDSTEELQPIAKKVIHSNLLQIKGYSITAAFTTVMEDDLHYLINKIRNDKGSAFFTKITINRVNKVNKAQLTQVNASQAMGFVSGRMSFYWVNICDKGPKVARKNN